jgi:glycosyltransferase involved in cell wall biosynthesis
MRVLHISGGNLYGGVETMLVTLARYRQVLPALDQEFALCFEARLSSELAASGAPVHLLGEVRTRRPFTVWRARRKLRGLLRERQIDAAVCHMPWSQAVFGPAARDANIPLVFWMHGPARGWHWLELWARLTPPDLTICNSRFTSSTLADRYRASPFEVVYPPLPPPAAGLSASERAAVRAALDTSPSATVIVQASRMESWKGQEVLLEALGRLRDLPGWVCWVAGGPQRPHERRYMETLERAASKLAIAGRVRFLGERSDVSRILRAADIYCQPNTGPEPFGLAFVEALGVGIPVISTAIGAATEIIDDSCGVLVEPGDIQALARTLRRLIEEPGERSRLGAAGPKRARALCDPGAQIKRLAGALARVVRLEAATINARASSGASAEAPLRQPL